MVIVRFKLKGIGFMVAAVNRISGFYGMIEDNIKPPDPPEEHGNNNDDNELKCPTCGQERGRGRNSVHCLQCGWCMDWACQLHPCLGPRHYCKLAKHWIDVAKEKCCCQR